jgi:hypothetical protein
MLQREGPYNRNVSKSLVKHTQRKLKMSKKTVAAVEGTETTVTTPAVAVVAAPKAPSKKSFAVAIFAAKMVEREQGLYATNKEFRAAVLGAIEADLGVSVASAATMYNACKKDAETAGTVTLGRDPKKVKVASTGKRGRPAKAKVEAVVVEAPAATEAVVEAVPA